MKDKSISTYLNGQETHVASPVGKHYAISPVFLVKEFSNDPQKTLCSNHGIIFKGGLWAHCNMPSSFLWQGCILIPGQKFRIMSFRVVSLSKGTYYFLMFFNCQQLYIILLGEKDHKAFDLIVGVVGGCFLHQQRPPKLSRLSYLFCSPHPVISRFREHRLQKLWRSLPRRQDCLQMKLKSMAKAKPKYVCPCWKG